MNIPDDVVERARQLMADTEATLRGYASNHFEKAVKAPFAADRAAHIDKANTNLELAARHAAMQAELQ